MNETMQHRIMKAESPVSTNFNADLVSNKEWSSEVNGLMQQHRSLSPVTSNLNNEVIHVQIAQGKLIHIKSPVSTQKGNKELSKHKTVQQIDPALTLGKKDKKINKKNIQEVGSWFRECEYLTTGIPTKSTTVLTKTNYASANTSNPSAKNNNASTIINNVSTITSNASLKTNNASLKTNNASLKTYNASSKINNASPKINNASPKINNASPKINNASPKINNASTITNNASPKTDNASNKIDKSRPRPNIKPSPKSWNLPVIKDRILLKYITELSKFYVFDRSPEAPPILHDVMMTSAWPQSSAPEVPKSYFSFDINQCF